MNNFFFLSRTDEEFVIQETLINFQLAYIEGINLDDLAYCFRVSETKIGVIWSSKTQL